MTRFTRSLALPLAGLALLLAGCQTATPTRPDRGYTAPAQPVQPAHTTWKPAASATVRPTPATPTPKDRDVVFRSHQVKVTKTLIQEAQVGGDVKYRITVEALEDVGAVRVTETFPPGIRFGSADPVASLSAGKAVWTFPDMRKSRTETIDVTVRPEAEGDHRICSTVSVDNDFCLDLFAGRPKLDVVKKGPASVELGETVTWSVTVANNGSAEATNVVVTDTLPDAFQPVGSLRRDLGDLAPGESQTVEYSAKAVRQGEFRNRAVAAYDGGGPGAAAESSAPIAVVQSGVRVRKSGPAEAYVFKPEKFEISIENTGDTLLRDVRITDILPQGATVADPGRGRVSGNAIGWMIPELPAGASQLITTEIAATRKGQATNTVKVLTPNGLEASDSVTTDWLAVPGVTISITDSKDPIRVKEATVYTIRVRNQGEFEPVSGTVTVAFNDSIRPTSVAGDARGVIRDQTVTFPRTTLEPGKDIDLSITADGAAIGPGRAVLRFTADFLVDPVISEEATNVY